MVLIRVLSPFFESNGLDSVLYKKIVSLPIGECRAANWFGGKCLIGKELR